MKTLMAFAALLFLAACSQEASSAADAPAKSASAEPAEIATPEARGRWLFNECAVCHSANEGEANRVGPNLFDIVGREAAQVDGFAYSKAMQDSGVVWTDETLSAFIENPQQFMRGNRMAYVGQRDAEKRADLIAYLKTLTPAAN